MTAVSLVSPVLRNNKISTFFKESYINAARNTLVRSLFERTPEKDVLYITSKYNRIPSLYDDLYSGKIKIFLHGLSDKPTPLFNDSIVKPETFKKMIEPDSLMGCVVKVFDTLDQDQKSISRISMQVKNDRLRLMTFDFDKKAIDQFDLSILDTENPFVKIMNYANNKHIDLYRD